MDEHDFMDVGLSTNDACKLLELNDRLYSEGFNQNEVDSIISNKISALKSKRFGEKKPSLKKIVLGGALGLVLAIGTASLIEDCTYFDSMKKDSVEYQHPMKRLNLNKSSNGGYGVE